MHTNKSTNKSVALPRGVLIFRKRRPGTPERPPCSRPWDRWPEDYFPSWRMRVRKIGVEDRVLDLLTTDEATAWEAAAVEWELICKARTNTRAAALIERPVSYCKLGDVLAAYWAFYCEGKPTAEAQTRRRVVTDARRLVAIGMGWVPAWGGDRMEDGSPMARRVDALGTEEALSVDLLREYFAQCQGGKFQPDRRERRNLTVNQRVVSARQLFSKRARLFATGQLTVPPLTEWMSFPLLPVSKTDKGDKLPSDEAMRALFAARAGLLASADAADRELGLVNLCLCQLGLRTRELLHARGSWLDRDAGGEWWLVVKDRPEEGFQVKNARPGRLRLGREEVPGSLAGYLVPRAGMGSLILPGGTPEGRGKLVRGRHNRWLKGFIGETESRQGNHRLRMWIGTIIAEHHGADAAARYLRDSNAVAWEHYIAQRPAAQREVTADWLRGLVAQ